MYSRRVWTEIDELAFHEKAILLEACSRSQDEEPRSLVTQHHQNTLDLPLARDFLDDFALVAAGSGGASNVAAACLELSETGGDAIIIRVAKNEDFNLNARQRLSQIAEIMNQVRQGGLPVLAGQDACFDLVAEACYPRILKQLSGPTGLWNLVQNFCTYSRELRGEVDIQIKACPDRPSDGGNFEDNRSDENESSKQPAGDLWNEMRELIEKLQVTRDLEVIKQLARLAYGVRHSTAFRKHIRTICPQESRSSQIVERIGKISRFFRSAVSLVRAAGCDILRSKHIKIETVRSVSRKITVLEGHTTKRMRERLPALPAGYSRQTAEIQRLLRRWQKYVVHAEMLLLTFYEGHPQITLATNYIGISKRSCYLCANFIRFHNTFTVEGGHQQLYCLWTLPEEIKFESKARSAKFVDALSDLQSLLTRRVDAVAKPQHRHLGFLKESVANFSRTTILARARSLENLCTITESEENLGSIISDSPLGPERNDLSVQLEQPRNMGLETGQGSSVQGNTVVGSSLFIIAEDSRNQVTASAAIKIPSSKDLGEELTKDSYRRVRRRERVHRLKSKGSPVTKQSDRQSKGRKGNIKKSQKSNRQVPRPGSAHRRRQELSEKRKAASVGCISTLVAYLKSSGIARLWKIFQGEVTINNHRV